MSERWTAEERDLCARGFVFLRDTRQARDGLRATVRSLAPYSRGDLVFDRPASVSVTNQSKAKP